MTIQMKYEYDYVVCDICGTEEKVYGNNRIWSRVVPYLHSLGWHGVYGNTYCPDCRVLCEGQPPINILTGRRYRDER